MSKDLKAEFWSRISKVQAGMLSTKDSRPVPMSPYADRDENAIWFITAQGTDLDKAAQGSEVANLCVSDPSANIYANVNGAVRLVDNPEKLDELWNVFASAWFKDGRDDSSVRLIQMRPARAEVWATEGAAAFLYDIAKANMSDQMPDGGDHGVGTF